MIKNMIETIIKTIADKPEEVSVEEIAGGSTSIIDIKVNKNDLGRMVGKGGKTAHSLRTIVYAASFKFGKRYTIEIQANEE